MINITDPKDCCGCTACMSICGHDAIRMKPDALGFMYPVADPDKCVNCGLCDKVCAFNTEYDRSENISPICYAGRHKDEKELRESRSGAVFIAFSDYILNMGGVVYGAGYTDNFRVIHKRAETKEERDDFKGSKYVQSDLNHVFSQIKQDLKDGKIVLFTGTPCQTAGLHSFIPKRLRTNLYLMDIICHAAPSPYIWRDYVADIEHRNKKKIVKTDFRDKTFGWSAEHKERFTFEDGTSITDFAHRWFFYASLDTRRSCSDCKYCNMNRPSDITIGDFWGYEKVVPEFNKDDKGVSVLIVSTEKGKQMLEASSKDLNLIPVEASAVYQPNLHHPTPDSPLRDKFEEDYVKHGYQYVLSHYGNSGWRYKLKFFRDKLRRKLHINQ